MRRGTEPGGALSELTLPAPGSKVRMAKSGTLITLDNRIGEGGQGVVYKAWTDRSSCYAVKWYRAAAASREQRDAISALVDYGRPHPAFLWPIDLVYADDGPGFGYLMPLREQRFISFAQMLSEEDQPPFRTLATIGRELVDAFAALHASGLCYRDVSFGNLFVDPITAEVAICDNDNVGIDGGRVAVYGTLRFMAPEVVRLEALPSTVTDLHSLAVLLFYLFVHGHPLDGRGAINPSSWDDDDRVPEDKLSKAHYGTQPVFVFDPEDDSNRPVDDDLMLTWWNIYPTFFREMFIKAFTTGLHDATLYGRLTEGVWRKGLLRLRDSVIECPSCSAARFYDPDEPRAACWNCNQSAPIPPVLHLPGSKVALSKGTTVTSHHLYRDREYRSVVGTVEPHPRAGNKVVLRNDSSLNWDAFPEGEDPRAVPPGWKLGVRSMELDFGPTQGRIACLEENSERSAISRF